MRLSFKPYLSFRRSEATEKSYTGSGKISPFGRNDSTGSGKISPFRLRTSCFRLHNKGFGGQVRLGLKNDFGGPRKRSGQAPKRSGQAGKTAQALYILRLRSHKTLPALRMTVSFFSSRCKQPFDSPKIGGSDFATLRRINEQ